MASLSCVASSDGRLLAVRRGALLTVHQLDLDGKDGVGAMIAETVLPHAEGRLAFAAGHVVDVAPRAGSTAITALALPKLKAVSVELPVPARLIGETGRHLLLAAEGVAHVVGLQGDSVAFAPMRVPAQLGWAVGIDDDQFLAASSRGLEIWDMVSRRPAGKLKLALPISPRAVGVASQRHNLWLVTDRAEITVVRISDGKTTRITLPAPPVAPVGHPATSWLVADLDGAPHAINLVTGACERLPAPSATARALAPRGAGTGAVVAQLSEAGELELWELGAPAARPPSAPGGLTLDVGVGATATPETRVAQVKTGDAIRIARAAVTQPRHVRLRPDVEVSLVGGPGRAEPATVARYIAPDVERRLAALAGHLRRVWLDRVCEAWLADDPGSRPRILRQLDGEARRAVIAIAGGLGEVEPDGRLRPRTPLLDEGVAAPWSAVRVAGPDGAAELPVEALDELGVALARLARGVAVEALADDPPALRAFEALAAAQLTAPAPDAPAFVGQLEPDTIAALGGHTLLARLGDAHVLVDPRFTPSAGDALPPPAVGDLPPLAAIVLTGDDPACLDVATLLLLDKHVPVIVPPAPPPARRAPRLARLLEELGFARVQVAEPGVPIAVGERGAIVAVAASASAPRHRARTGYVLVGERGAAVTGGAFPLDAADLPALTVAAAAAGVPVSPWFVATPRRRTAPIEAGWQWLFEASDDWLRGAPDAPADLAGLRAAAGDAAIVLCGDDAPAPEGDADVRRADCYDRFRLGAGQDGWLQPRE